MRTPCPMNMGDSKITPAAMETMPGTNAAKTSLVPGANHQPINVANSFARTIIDSDASQDTPPVRTFARLCIDHHQLQR